MNPLEEAIFYGEQSPALLSSSLSKFDPDNPNTIQGHFQKERVVNVAPTSFESLEPYLLNHIIEDLGDGITRVLYINWDEDTTPTFEEGAPSYVVFGALLNLPKNFENPDSYGVQFTVNVNTGPPIPE